jgi:hypothetical protein
MSSLSVIDVRHDLRGRLVSTSEQAPLESATSQTPRVEVGNVTNDLDTVTGPEREVALLCLDAPAGIRRRRLAIRNAPRDRGNLAASAFESSERVLIGGAIVLDDTEQDLARQLALAIEAVSGVARPAERRTSESRVASSS